MCSQMPHATCHMPQAALLATHENFTFTCATLVICGGEMQRQNKKYKAGEQVLWLLLLLLVLVARRKRLRLWKAAGHQPWPLQPASQVAVFLARFRPVIQLAAARNWVKYLHIWPIAGSGVCLAFTC